MGTHAVRWMTMALATGVVAFSASRAAAFSMAEQMATTGVSSSLAAQSAPSASRTIGSVKNKLSASAPKLPGMRTPTGPGAGAPRVGKRAGGSKTGWGTATKGWSKSGAGGGKNGKSWRGRSGAWPQADGWDGRSTKAWAASGGGAWARPGKKS